MPFGVNFRGVLEFRSQQPNRTTKPWQARELVILFQLIMRSFFEDPERNGTVATSRLLFTMETACMVDMAWSTKSICQNNSLVAAQILIECQFTKLEAGVTKQPANSLSIFIIFT